MRFRDRADAGARLAEAVRERQLTDPMVLGLPRGGVPVAFVVAAILDAPLDVFVARKIGAPGDPELGIGAIAEGDVVVADPLAVQILGVSGETFNELAERERRELHRRVERYRGSRPVLDVAGRAVVLVDDGLATGVTAEAALRALRERKPTSLVLASPACADDTAERLSALADDVVCVLRRADFYAVGQWYERFDQTTDDEVVELLARSRAIESRRA
jgi:putative phosphoribosyl transferase